MMIDWMKGMKKMKPYEEIRRWVSISEMQNIGRVLGEERTNVLFEMRYIGGVQLKLLSGEIKGAVRYKNLEFRKLEIGIWNWVKVVNGDGNTISLGESIRQREKVFQRNILMHSNNFHWAQEE